MDLSSIKSSDSISLKSDSARSFNEDDQNDGNHFLQSPGMFVCWKDFKNSNMDS